MKPGDFRARRGGAGQQLVDHFYSIRFTLLHSEKERKPASEKNRLMWRALIASGLNVAYYLFLSYSVSRGFSDEDRIVP
jgi:hypothetical protein